MALIHFLLFLLCICLQLGSILSNNIALLVIDVQNCFLPGGSLAVTEGDRVIPVINEIRSKYSSSFSLVILSQDWHCSDHISFSSQHANTNPFQDIQLLYDSTGSLCDASHNCSEISYNLTQRLWPDHCVMNTASSELSTNLTHLTSDVIIKKGYNCKVDSYSAFFDNGQFRHTELNQKLKNARIDTVFVTGLARDFCVYYTAKDAKMLGYETYVVLDATRPVGIVTGQEAVTDMTNKGIHIINSTDMASTLLGITSGTDYNNTACLLTLVITFIISCLFM